MSASELVTQELEERTAILTVSRPQVLNALNKETLEALGSVLKILEKEPEISAVILKGAGRKAFVAGADIRELAELSPLAAAEYSTHGQEVLGLVDAFPKPVIAAIHGYCLGGGCELAMACHVRIASEQARLGQPEVTLGLIPGFGGTQRLLRLVGKGRALELLLSGNMISAAEAERIGLVNRVVSAEDLMPTCLELAERMAGNAPYAVRSCLEAVRLGESVPLEKGLSYESSLFGLVAATEDKVEGTQAFLEKRRPDFRGK
jgi:enoyl-CoA hydratase